MLYTSRLFSANQQQNWRALAPIFTILFIGKLTAWLHSYFHHMNNLNITKESSQMEWVWESERMEKEVTMGWWYLKYSLRQKVVDSVPSILVHTCNLALGNLRKTSKFNARMDYRIDSKGKREGVVLWDWLPWMKM